MVGQKIKIINAYGQKFNQFKMRKLLFLSLAISCKSNPLRILNDHDLLFGDPEMISNGQIQPTDGQKHGTIQGNCLKLDKDCYFRLDRHNG